MEKENFPQIKYRIKLLAGNNVVLLEADNYDTEIFTPQVVNGRLTFLNIIPNRRCCLGNKTNSVNYQKNQYKNTRTDIKGQNIIHPRKVENPVPKFSAFSCPLANSTPAGEKHSKNYDKVPFKSNHNMNFTDTTLQTPELVRRAEPARRELLEKSMLFLSTSVRASHIYTNTIKGTPVKKGRFVTSLSSASQTNNSVNISLLNSSYQLPCSPSVLTHTKNGRSVVNVNSNSLDSFSRWQKVITPVRTYTRNSEKPIMVQRPISIDCMRSFSKSSKFKPTYLVNPTQAPIPTKHIEIKRRRVLVDNKTSISPRSFKKQQKQTLNVNEIKLETLHPNSLNLHKPRSYMETVGMSAFDLLTNSNRKRIMAAKLNERFRKSCVNKAASTYNKYKILSTVPPLQQDEQVLKLSRISLQSLNAE